MLTYLQIREFLVRVAAGSIEEISCVLLVEYIIPILRVWVPSKEWISGVQAGNFLIFNNPACIQNTIIKKSHDYELLGSNKLVRFIIIYVLIFRYVGGTTVQFATLGEHYYEVPEADQFHVQVTHLNDHYSSDIVSCYHKTYMRMCM